jgi:hypothetical protein
MLIGTEENRRKVTIDIPQKPGVRPGTMKELVPTLSWSEEENVKSLRHMDRRDAFNNFHHYSETYAKFYIHKEGGSPEEIKIKWINNRIRSKNTRIQVDNMQIL